MRVRRTLLVTVSAALAFAAAVSAAPERRQLIQPGVGIGKVRIGMTLEQVRAALGGRHQTATNQRTFRSGGRYVELSWEKPGRLSWEPYIWTIGFQSDSQRGKLRAVRVSSNDPREKTRDGLGVGSRVRAILHRYPAATCVSRQYDQPWGWTWIVVRHTGGAMTAFLLGNADTTSTEPRRVTWVLVQREWFPRQQNPECGGENWRRW